MNQKTILSSIEHNIRNIRNIRGQVEHSEHSGSGREKRKLVYTHYCPVNFHSTVVWGDDRNPNITRLHELLELVDSSQPASPLKEALSKCHFEIP